jgi:hypothetical protein
MESLHEKRDDKMTLRKLWPFYLVQAKSWSLFNQIFGLIPSVAMRIGGKTLSERRPAGSGDIETWAIWAIYSYSFQCTSVAGVTPISS